MHSDAARPGLQQVELSETVTEILSQVETEELRGQVEHVVRHCVATLVDIARIHLPHDNFEEGGGHRPSHDRHQELAPYVLASVASINALLSYLFETFPPPATGADSGDPSDDDFDLEFDLVDGPTGEGSGLSGKEHDNVMTSDERVADAAHAFGAMLRSRVLSFGGRLRHALAQEDNWPLLAEVDDNKHRLAKSVQGVLFGVLSVFAPDARREQILPEYRSAVGEAVKLRAALTDLTYHVNRFNGAVGKASSSEDLVPLVVGLADRLKLFSSRPEYHTLRAEDKKCVVDFRGTLFKLRHTQTGIPLVPLRHAVEGFSKFLESMQAINHREVLVLHDRQRLTDGLALIDKAFGASDSQQAKVTLEELVELMGSVIGRHPDLDEAHRSFSAESIEAASVPEQLVRWQGVLEGTLAVLG